MLKPQQKKCNDCRCVLFWIIDQSRFYCPKCKTYTSVKYAPGIKSIEDMYSGNPRIMSVASVQRIQPDTDANCRVGRSHYPPYHHHQHYYEKPDLVLVERPKKGQDEGT